jgi:hypothetical protein
LSGRLYFLPIAIFLIPLGTYITLYSPYGASLTTRTIEALRPDYFRVAFRVSQVAQIRGRDFSGVYPHFLTLIGRIWRGFEEAGIASASSLYLRVHYAALDHDALL